MYLAIWAGGGGERFWDLGATLLSPDPHVAGASERAAALETLPSLDPHVAGASERAAALDLGMQ